MAIDTINEGFMNDEISPDVLEVLNNILKYELSGNDILIKP